VAKFRGRARVINAMQFTDEEGNRKALEEFSLDAAGDPDVVFYVDLHGGHEVYDHVADDWYPLKKTDWVVKGRRGEHYVMESDDFNDAYEPIMEDCE
jgi:hypothetical protein